MGQRVLVPYDGSPLSERALELAVTGNPDDEVTVLHVVYPIQAELVACGDSAVGVCADCGAEAD